MGNDISIRCEELYITHITYFKDGDFYLGVSPYPYDLILSRSDPNFKTMYDVLKCKQAFKITFEDRPRGKILDIANVSPHKSQGIFTGILDLGKIGDGIGKNYCEILIESYRQIHNVHFLCRTMNHGYEKVEEEFEDIGEKQFLIEKDRICNLVEGTLYTFTYLKTFAGKRYAVTEINKVL